MNSNLEKELERFTDHGSRDFMDTDSIAADEQDFENIQTACSDEQDLEKQNIQAASESSPRAKPSAKLGLFKSLVDRVLKVDVCTVTTKHVADVHESCERYDPKTGIQNFVSNA